MITQSSPKIISTTQIQRKPQLLQDIDDSEYRYITHRTNIIGVYVSLPLFEALQTRQQATTPLELPHSLTKKLRSIDPIAYQQQIRNEY